MSPSDAHAEAVRFVTDLVSDLDLLRGYATVVDEVARSATKDPAPIDAFLTTHGYTTTAEWVAAAEAAVEADQVGYWAGAYTTSYVDASGTKTDGPQLTINPDISGRHRIGLSTVWLVAPAFATSTLVWLRADDDGTELNETEGSLVFTLTNLQSGGIARGFAGTVTDVAHGTRTLVGVQAAATHDAPPGQDLDMIKSVTAIAASVVAVIAVATVIVTVWKGRRECQKLDLEIARLRRENRDAEAAELQRRADAGRENADALDRYAEDVNAAAQPRVADVERLPPPAREQAGERLDIEIELQPVARRPAIPPEQRDILQELVERELDEPVGVRLPGAPEEQIPVGRDEDAIFRGAIDDI
jgi:hypothetical protein